jgi:hypothetical protein
MIDELFHYPADKRQASARLECPYAMHDRIDERVRSSREFAVPTHVPQVGPGDPVTVGACRTTIGV